jgi:ubiquinone/menaquinone biosynthesis C-methylase UbiE
MAAPDIDKRFTGSIPKIYDTYLVPLIFQPYADDLSRRAASLRPRRVIEIAAGTGAVTRTVAATLPASASVTATDLNPAMLDYARGVGASRQVEWRQADVAQLPFDSGAFDLAICQFGAMFFPDRVAAFSEVRRVLAAEGTFLFNVWDRIELNEFTDEIERAVALLFPDDPPRFLSRTPHGYHAPELITADLHDAGFTNVNLVTVTERSRAASARVAAVAFCEGTPLRNEIEVRDPARLPTAVDVATEALARRFGHGPIDGGIQAHVVTARAR